MQNLWTPGTKRYKIAELLISGSAEDTIYDLLSPLVRDQIKPWIFSANIQGRRQPKEISDQLVELRHEISRTHGALKRQGQVPVSRPVAPETPKPDWMEETPKPRAKGKIDRAQEKEFFYAEWLRLRTWIKETSDRTGANPVDSLDTMRPLQGARAMIDQGISARTMLYAMTLHWSQATRDQAGIESADFTAESEPIAEGFHTLSGYVQKVFEARIPCMLIGPAGSGKSYVAKQVAATIKTDSHPDGLPYGETPMTPGATRGDLLGRHTLEGFITSQFVEIYSGGGVFNFEEIDASDPSMLIVVNNALASDKLFDSSNGEVYDRHPDFIPVATANTFGLGANAQYTGREKLDLATIDRFRMGRVLVGLDENLAKSMILG